MSDFEEETADPEVAYQKVRDEVAGRLDLTAVLDNRGIREGQVTLFLDEATGDRLGYARDETNQFGLVVGRERHGVLGEIDALDETADDYEKSLKRLSGDRDALLKVIKETALIVKLRAVPPVVLKAGQRSARKHLGIKGKIPENLAEGFAEFTTSQLLADTVVSITYAANGQSTGTITREEALTILERLPETEFRKLDAKLGDMQWGNAFDETVAGDSDF